MSNPDIKNDFVVAAAQGAVREQAAELSQKIAAEQGYTPQAPLPRFARSGPFGTGIFQHAR